jgi:hypothetical protein
MAHIRTELRIAPFGQPDGSRLAKLTLTFRGALPDSEAATKAKHIVEVKPLNHSDRGYLLNCLNIGNYEVEVIL